MMPEIIVYLLKVNLALVLFYTGYHFILQRYTFHTVNRFYLLIGLVYSALYPLVNISELLNRNEQLKERVGMIAPDWQGSVTLALHQAENGAGSYWQVVLMIFWTGVIIMSMRLLIQLASLFILHVRSSSYTLGSIKFRKISKAVNPFSFWRTIYLNPECHEAAELRSILEHEQVHVRQLHTFDVMLAEISTIFYWFNPGVWLMKKAIKANLEFITDQEVIRSGIDSKEYQYNLLKTQVLPQNQMPVNNFHFLTIKKRIAMINKKPSNRINLSGYLLILPAIMILALMIGSSNAASNNKAISQIIRELPDLPATIRNAAENPSASQLMSIKKLATESLQSLNEVKGSDTTKSQKVVIRAKSSGEVTQHEMQEVYNVIIRKDTIKTTKTTPIYIIDGKRIDGIGFISPDSIASIHVMKGEGATTVYGIEGKDGVVEIRTKSNASYPKSAGSKGSNVVGYGLSQNQNISIREIEKQLIIVDGKEITKLELDQIKVSTISSINTLKGSAAVSKYGEKGENGVIVITTKK